MSMKIVSCLISPAKEGRYYGVSYKGYLGILEYRNGSWYTFQSYKEKTVWFIFTSRQKCDEDEFFINPINPSDFYWINNHD